MPRKGTKPSYQQIALHLVANSIAPNEISTATQSAEFTSLETMMQEIEEITQREFHSSAIKQRFQRLLTSTKQLLESAKKARALKIDKDQTGYAEEIKQTAALAEAFDKELRSFAEHRDFRVQLGFFGIEPCRDAYNLWNEDGEYAVNPQELSVFDPPVSGQGGAQQPNPNQVKQVGQNQPNPNLTGLNQPGSGVPNQNQPSGNQPNSEQPNMNQSGANVSGANEPDPNQSGSNVPNPNQPQQPSMAPDAGLSEIALSVKKAAVYAAQADDEEFGEDLQNLETFLDGIDQELVRISEIQGSELYAKDLQDLSDAGHRFMEQTIKARETIDKQGSTGQSRKAIDDAAAALRTFEAQYQKHLEVYEGDVERLGGMADFDDRRDKIDLSEGSDLLERAGYHPPKYFFAADLPLEQVVLSLAESTDDLSNQSTKPVELLRELDDRLRKMIKEKTAPAHTLRNCQLLADAGSELFYALNYLRGHMQDAEPEKAREAVQDCVKKLRRFNTIYETFQRYDPEGLAPILGDLGDQAARTDYAAGRELLSVLGYEEKNIAGKSVYQVPADPKETNERGIPYAQIARSLSSGEWIGQEFAPSDELAAVSQLIARIESELEKSQNRYRTPEETAAYNLKQSAKKLLQSALDLSALKDDPLRAEKALSDTVASCIAFDETYRLFKRMNPDFASKYTEEFDKIWPNAAFEAGIVQPTPEEQPKAEEPVIIQEEPVISFTGSKKNSLVIAADFMVEEKKRDLLSAFRDELDDQIMLYEKAGKDEEFLKDLRSLHAAARIFRDNLRDARLERKNGTSIEKEMAVTSDAARGAEELEKELRSFNQKHPGVLGENGRKFAALWQKDPFEKGPEELSDIGRYQTAHRHIERLKAELKDNPGMSDEGVKGILAHILLARELSGATPENSANLKQKRFSEMELLSSYQQHDKNPMFQKFLDSIPAQRARAMVLKGNGASYQKAYELFQDYCYTNRNYVLPKPDPQMSPSDLAMEEREENVALTGEVKTAAKWIEDAQRKIKRSRSTDEISLQVARIFAARQLAEAVRGDRENIDKARLSESQIERRAKDLLKGKGHSDVFNRFLSTMRDAPLFGEEEKHRYRKELMDAALSGHGGRLEDKMRIFCHSIPNGEQMNHRLYQRYKPFYYSNYTDYLFKSQNERYLLDGRGDVRNDKLRLAHAQKRMTAYKLATETYNRSFNKKIFEEDCREMSRNPLFKVMTMNDNRCRILNAGEPDEIMNAMQQVVSDFTPQLVNGKPSRSQGKLTQRAVSDLYRKLTGGRKGEDLEKFLDGRSAAYRHMVDAAERYANKYETPDATDAMEVFTAVIDYQKDKETQRKSPGGERAFTASLELAKTVVQGTKAEKYLKEQLEYINEKRGFAPEADDPKKLHLEDIASAIDARKQQEENQPKNEPARGTFRAF